MVGDDGRDAAPPEAPAPVRGKPFGTGAGPPVVVVVDGAGVVVLPAASGRSPRSRSGLAVTVPVGSAPSGPVGMTIGPSGSDPSGSVGIRIGPTVRGPPGPCVSSGGSAEGTTDDEVGGVVSGNVVGGAVVGGAVVGGTVVVGAVVPGGMPSGLVSGVLVSDGTGGS